MDYTVSYKENVQDETFDITVVCEKGQATGFVNSKEMAEKIVKTLSSSEEKAKKYFDQWVNY